MAALGWSAPATTEPAEAVTGECDCLATYATVDGDVADLDDATVLHAEGCILRVLELAE